MKCTVTKETFLTHLQKVVNIISKKAILPILNNIMIEATGSELKLTANSLDMNIETSMTANVASEGFTTLPAYRLLDLVNRLNDKEIELERDKNFHCKITCGNASFKLLGMNPVDYPEFPAVESEQTLTMKNKVYIRMIDQVSYAVSRDDSRKILQGILFELKDQTLNVVATDGKRLALAKTAMDDCEDRNCSIVIPHRAAVELKKILDEDGTMEMEFNSKHLCVKSGTVTFKTKLVEGNFPPYQQVIPQEFGKSVELTTGSFAQSLDLVSVPLNSGDNVSLKFAAGKLELHTQTASVGEGSDTLAVPYDYEDEMEFSFNPEFLRAPFRFSGTDTLMFRMNDTHSPIALENSNGFMYILMPLRSK